MYSFGAYFAKNGKKTDNMTPTIANMYPHPIWQSPALYMLEFSQNFFIVAELRPKG